MDSKTQLKQLKEAKVLAMDNSPEQMLPKVLETTDSLVTNAFKNSNIKGDSEEFVELSRFFTQLFSDTLNHEQIPTSELPFIASKHLDTLWLICSNCKDPVSFKFTVLSFSSIYPLLFDLVAKTSNEKLWNLLQTMKKFIVNRWKRDIINLDSTNGIMDQTLTCDAKHIGCKLAMIKFLSQAIIVQTNIMDNKNDSLKNKKNNNPHGNYIYSINLLSVPDNHPVISNKSKLESESKVYLDLLLNYLIEEPMMVSSTFIGVINCLSFVMKERPQTTTRILSGLLKFNVDAKYQLDNMSTINYKLAKRFVERCYKNFVQFGIRNQLIKNSSSMNQIYTKLTKISQTLHIIGEESKSKGVLNFDSKQIKNKISDSDRNKVLSHRLKIQQKYFGDNTDNKNGLNADDNTRNDSEISSTLSTPAPQIPPINNKNVTLLADLQKYTLTKDLTTKFLNNSPIAINNSYSAIFSLMNSEDSKQNLSELPQDVLSQLATEAIFKADTTKLISGLSIVASRYTDLMAKSNGSKRKNESTDGIEVKRQKRDSSEVKNETDSESDKEELEPEIEEDTVDLSKILAKPQIMNEVQKLATAKRIIQNIMAIKDNNMSPSLTMTSVESPYNKVKLLEWKNTESWYQVLVRLATRGTNATPQISDLIRDELLSYILSDFQNNITIIIEWLNEEWYSENILKINKDDTDQPTNYKKWSLRVLEELIPFMENQHRRIFIRLMSELPRLEQEHFDKIKPILLDPGRSALGFQTLKFLIMFRSPVKAPIKILLQQLMQEDSSLQEKCQGILDKYYSTTPEQT